MNVIQYAKVGLNINQSRHLAPKNVDIDCDFDLEELAEEAADDYHSNYDGWESQWPLDIELWVDSVSVGVFTVEREFDPVFSASRKKESV